MAQALSENIWGPQFYNDNWSVDAAVQQVFAKGRANLKVCVTDIFNTVYFRTWFSYANSRSEIYNKYDSRQLRVNLNYRIGSATIKAVKARKSGLEEEKNRSKDVNN